MLLICSTSISHHADVSYLAITSTTGEKRIINIDRFIVDPQLVPAHAQDNKVNASNTATKSSQAISKLSTDSSEGMVLAVLGGSQPMASSNALTITTQDGVPELQTIRTYSDGAVVLKRLSSLVDTEQCLLYLPDKTQGRASATILNSNDADPDSVRAMLIPDTQDTYSLDDPMARQSATIISRPVQSIQEYYVPRLWRSLVSLACIM